MECFIMRDGKAIQIPTDQYKGRLSEDLGYPLTEKEDGFYSPENRKVGPLSENDLLALNDLLDEKGWNQ